LSIDQRFGITTCNTSRAVCLQVNSPPADAIPLVGLVEPDQALFAMVFADIHSVGNEIEAVLWFVIATVLLVAGNRRPTNRNECWIAAAALIAFGLSDVVEIQTGAWWRPWWLLVWKGGCIVVLVWLFWQWRAQRRKERTAI
jgi:hypothetical protein